MNITHQIIQTNGLQLHVALSGEDTKPAIVLLHGFPEFWYGWKKQIPALVTAGYRVIVPDQRGYNLSSKPSKISDYDIDLLAQDIVGLLDALKIKKTYLVGHDWGGLVAWWIALKHPQRLNKLAILNAPHPITMSEALKKSWAQRLKSWYIAFFQIPKLPEWIWSAFNYSIMTYGLKSSSRAGTFSKSDIDEYRKTWSSPGTLHAMINWYRASARKSLRGIANIKIKTPTLILWGDQDAFLETPMAYDSAKHCTDATVKIVPGATHWVQHEEPEIVNKMLADFFCYLRTTPDKYLSNSLTLTDS